MVSITTNSAVYIIHLDYGPDQYNIIEGFDEGSNISAVYYTAYKICYSPHLHCVVLKKLNMTSLYLISNYFIPQ